MNFRIAGMGLCAMLLLAGCADSTDSIGIASDIDVISSSVQTFDFTTRSVELGAVTANSSKCYLGRVRDADTGIDVTADFLAQFHSSENYMLPEQDRLVKNADGTVACTGVELRLYYDTYIGDGSSPMKLEVYELDRDNVIREDQTYYSDTDLFAYVNPQRTTPVATKSFTGVDQTVSEEDRASTTYTPNIYIPLDLAEGQRILQLAVDHPEYFADSYQFIHNVCPGYYFKLTSGIGTMITIQVCVLNVNFQYVDQDGNTQSAVARFSATPEVIQSTRIENKGIAELLSTICDADGSATQPFTYLTAPAGIATEATLPVYQIYQNHEGDSISRARILLTCLNDENSLFGKPSSLLMVRNAAVTSFFENRQVADGITSFIASFDTSANGVTFDNINQLISYLYHEKQTIMQRDGLTDAQYAAVHPDWNRVMLIPVVTAVNSSSILTSVQHEFSPCSVRIVGGTEPLKMQVIYSTYKNRE